MAGQGGSLYPQTYRNQITHSLIIYAASDRKIGDGTHSFTHERSSDGIILRLTGKAMELTCRANTGGRLGQSYGGSSLLRISRILALADDADSGVEDREDGLFIDHRTVASLSEPQAAGLGLPPSVRFALQVNTKNLITDHDFGIVGRWVDEANRSLRVKREGAFLFVEEASTGCLNHCSVLSRQLMLLRRTTPATMMYEWNGWPTCNRCFRRRHKSNSLSIAIFRTFALCMHRRFR